MERYDLNALDVENLPVLRSIPLPDVLAQDGQDQLQGVLQSLRQMGEG